MAKKFVFKGTGLTKEEIKWGQKRFDDYLESFPHLNSNLGSLQSLEEIVWVEVIQERYKQKLGALAKGNNSSNTQSTSIPATLQKSIQDGLNMIMELKAKLGMFEEQKQQEGLEAVEALMNKTELYRKTHLDIFKLTCPFCVKMFFLNRRMEDYDNEVTPYFHNRLLNNRPLFRIYKQGRVTKEQVAEVLGISTQFVDWLEKKVYGLGTLPDNEQDPKIE
jgi:hypothetical protein